MTGLDVTTIEPNAHPIERTMTPQFPNAVERWPLERLIPHARNARTHSEAQVAQIAGSIAEFGFVNPVLVGDDGVMVAGHGRVLAARLLGLSEAPVIVLSHLTPTQRRALMIADNRIAANSSWDEEMLAAELAALKEEAFDIDLLGFDDAELDRLLAGTGDETSDLDAAPAPGGPPDARSPTPHPAIAVSFTGYLTGRPACIAF